MNTLCPVPFPAPVGAAHSRWRGALLAALLALCASASVAAAGAAPSGTEAARVSIDLPDGGHYRGALKNGKLDGQGRIDWGPDQNYEGSFAGGFMEGQGRLVNNVYVYEGQFQHGEMSGQGTLTFKNSSTVYVGQFKHGQMSGQGKLTRNNNWVYVGQFAHNQMNGTGKLTIGGTVYEGQFKNDKLDGPIRMTDSNGVIIEGRFGNDGPVGEVAISWPSGFRYKGPQKNAIPDGQGMLTRPDKAVLRANFAHGDVEGTATITYPDGAVYTGAVSEDYHAEGQGELRRPNGAIYKGHFADDQFDGQGTLTQAGGKAQTGYWRAGQYLGQQGDGTLEDTPELAASNNETALYNQQALLDREFAQLKPSPASGPAQMYALLVAGDGQQEVFRREAAYVDGLLAQRFGTGGHSVRLVNSRSSVAQWPLASAHSIELALKALAQKMNRQRDLLFVFVTSHGSREHELELDMDGMALPNLTPQQLRKLLDASGIRNKVIVLSACYAGGFIPALQSDRTWIITAARADRSSFGCADDRDFTYFGRALFADSLPTAPTLSAAFAHATELVHQWEEGDAQKEHKSAAAPANARQAPSGSANAQNGDADQDDQGSHPQSSVTPAFRTEVDAWFAAHPPVPPAQQVPNAKSK